MQITREIVRACAEQLAFYEFAREQLRTRYNQEASPIFEARLAEVEKKISKYDAELRLAMRNYLTTKSAA